WQRARAYLKPHRPVFAGIDLNQLIADLDDWFSRIPSDWRDRLIHPADVAQLNLPAVRLRVVDPDLDRRVLAWRPGGNGSSG
ncbi:MAG: hypothetical protein K6T30_07430, partial [Alicyclobacillus sp.]|nr:hypothetical protein [Alicyclobacillus sp.]